MLALSGSGEGSAQLRLCPHVAFPWCIHGGRQAASFPPLLPFMRVLIYFQPHPFGDERCKDLQS